MTLREMQEKREKLVHDAREALDEIRKNTDEARAAELEKRHDDIMVEFDRLDAQIAREERHAAAERRAEETRERMRPNPGGTEARGAGDDDEPEYREVYHRLFQVGGNLLELSDEERAVLRRGHAPSEARAQTTTGGGGAAGGYTVPTELSNQLIVSMRAWGPMYDEDICTVMNTTGGNPIKLPTIDDTAVTAERHTEAGTVTDDGGKDATFGQKSLDAFAYDTEWVRWSWELSQDSIFNFETLLGDLLGQRLGRIANSELTTGDGSGAPHGIVAASSLGKTAAAEAAITTDELIDLIHSVDPAYRQSPKVRFMFNDTTLSVIRKLKNGTGDYLWSAGDMTQGVAASLLGYRYSINQAVPNVAAGQKPVLFGDFGKYFVRKVGSIITFVARERFAPDLGILGLVRFDGELGDAAAVKHLIQAA